MTDTKENQFNEKSAVAWSYLDTINLAYKVLLDAQAEYSNIYNDKANKYTIAKARRNFAAKLHSFYFSTDAKFGAYLLSDDFKAAFKESTVTETLYTKLYLDELEGKQLFEMTQIICVWAQTLGPFRTVNTSMNPSKALMGNGYGGSY